VRILKITALIILILIVLTFLGFFVNEKINETVFVTRYTFEHKEIPQEFDGSKILVISDLHEADFSKQIVEHIKKEKPDFVAMLGDMVQLPDTSFDKTLEVVNECVKMNVPVYAVSGNHDRQCGEYDNIIDHMWAADAYMLENGSVKFEKGGQSILLAGIKDPRHDEVTAEKYKIIRGNIEYELSKEDDMFTILLSHRADMYPEIKDTGVDLILSGHLHGGIVRLPFVGGIIGRDGKESLFPDYEYGVIKEGDSATMIVSGGCDKNPLKKRYFNPPEVLLITLKGE